MESSGPTSKPTALADWAYATLKDAILSLELPMGSQLNIEELTASLDCSRTPVREALLRLEKDGLVGVVPRVGFFVTEITRRDIEELLEIRQLLEAHVVRRAAPVLSEADLRLLYQLLDDAGAAVESGRLERFAEATTDFHKLLLERAPNRRLIGLMATLEDLTHRERMLALRSPGNVRESLAEHRRIADALRQGDGELSAHMMEDHIAGIRRRLLEFLDSAADDGAEAPE